MFDFFNIPASDAYNCFFELTALIMLLFVAGNFFFRKNFATPITKLYSVALIVSIINLIANLVSSYYIGRLNAENVTLITRLSSGIFYFTQIATPVFLATFMLYSSGRSYKSKRYMVILIPAVVSILILLINPFANLMYNVVSVDGVKDFVHGPLFFLVYVNAFFYIILTIIISILFKKDLEKSKVIFYYSVSAVIVVALGIQIAFTQVLLTGLAVTIVMFLIGESIAKPDEMIDKITGVYNLNAMVEYLDLKRSTAKNKYYLLLNIANLTTITEACGVAAASDLNKSIGSFLNGLGKKIYTFKARATKFIINAPDEETINSIVDRIKARFNKPWKVREFTIELKVFGIILVNNELFNNAEEYMDFVNQIGTDVSLGDEQFIHFDDSIIKNRERRKQIINIVKKALDESTFRIVYQPIYNLKTKKFDSCESLIRLGETELGFIGPGEFIPIAEAAGLVNRIDSFVLHSVCQFLCEHPEINHIEVNISCAEFFNNPSKQFIDIINKYDINPSRITIELTETVASLHQEKSDQFMTDMCAIGVNFALDDFGTGYSNISRLMTSPFSMVKLDKSLLENNERINKFLDSSVKLFNSLNLPIVIEGVETEEQLELAKKFNIDFVQGYYFSKPIEKDQFLEFMKNN